MNRRYDKLDMLVAACLMAVVATWAFIWSYPYPHPDSWPFLVALKNKVSLSVLSTFGKLGLGVFASIAYLLMRGSWMLHRDIEDEFPDRFFFTRLAPLCASISLACMSYVWRPAQFMAPGAVLGLVLVVAVWLWVCNCLYDWLSAGFFSYLLLAFVAGMTPIGLLALGYVGISDIVWRWQENLVQGQGKDYLMAFARRSSEAALSLVATIMGLVSAIGVGAVYFTRGLPSGGLVAIALAWWDGWVASVWPVLSSEMFIAMSVSGFLVVAALALGRRIRAIGPRGRIMAFVMMGFLVLASIMMFVRAVDLLERRRLAVVGEYVRQTVADAADVQWLFTDGRFDDALRFELKRQGRGTVILDSLNAPTAEKAARLRGYAPEPGDRYVFAAGGAEVFKAWARERPDRLASSAWQFGDGIVRRFGKIRQRTCGSVMKGERSETANVCDESDRAFMQFSESLLSLMDRSVTHGIPFGSEDKTLSSKCDAVLWRAARLAGTRSEQFSEAGDMEASQREHRLMLRLDACNASLCSQGNMLERLLPTANLVLTSRESLDIALKRADFILAQRYAHEVLVGTPDDPSAHFALGMYSLANKDYFVAAQHFEQVLKKRPEEPAALNNLSMAYFKLQKYEEALALALHAQKVRPNSDEINDNVEAIRKAMKTVDSDR